MPSKELIALVAEAIIENPPIETMTNDEIILDWSPTAQAAISTIRAALQEPNEAMIEAGYVWDEHVTATETHPRNRGVWRAMINSSPLGEKSE